MLIDFHTHAFPDKIAARAIASLSHASGGLLAYTDGTLNGLKRSMAEGGVDISVMLSIATNAHQQKAVNDFAAAVNGKDGIVAFGSVFPESEDAVQELERIKELGLKGIKFHPEYQHFYVDDEKMKPLYKKISELGLITVFHAGTDIGFAPPYHAMPKNMARALAYFDSPVVAAHFGGAGSGEDVLRYLCGNEMLYIDTSFSYGAMPKYYAQTIIERHGADRILFGTDTPWHCPDMEKRLVASLDLSDSEREKICSENARHLLGI